MSNYILTNEEDLTVIADAVRSSTNSTETFNVPKLSQIASELIMANEGGSSVTMVVDAHNNDGSAHADIRESVQNTLTEAKSYADTAVGNIIIPEQVQVDWNQSDSGAADFIKNKPFYEEEVGEIIVLGPSNIEREWSYYDYTNSLVENNTYTVVFDETEYKCVSYRPSENYYNNFIFLGNSYLCFGGSDNTEMPFCVYCGDEITVVVQDASIPHTISIKGKEIIVHKIDEKYLPDITVIGKKGTGDNSEVFNNNFIENASGNCSHVEGYHRREDTGAHGSYSHSEGESTVSNGSASHSEGHKTIANVDYSHAEGYKTRTYGVASHAEGSDSEANGYGSHAEGLSTRSDGFTSHAEGIGTIAALDYQHAQGKFNIADTKAIYQEKTVNLITDFSEFSDDYYFHTLWQPNTTNLVLDLNSGLFKSNSGTINSLLQVTPYSLTVGSIVVEDRDIALGKYIKSYYVVNKINSYNSFEVTKHYAEQITDSTYAHIVGNGSNELERSNAHTLDWSGNAWFAGDVYTGSISGVNKDAGSKKLATEDYVNTKVEELENGDDGVPTNHASADTTYGMATEEMYGHARAYASPHFPEGDEEGTHLVAPDGSEFEFGVPSGYFLDMALFSAVYRIYGMTLQDLQFQIDETSDILFETKQDVNELNTALDNQSTQILNMATPINELQRDLSRLSTELEEVSNFVKEENETDLSQYLRGQDGTVELGYKESQYKLQVNNDGVDILQGNTSMTHIGQNTVSAPTFEAARTVKIGNHTIKMSTSGTLMFN